MAEIYEKIGVYTPGGRNVMSERYTSGGTLPYKDKAVWIGVLTPDWHGAGYEIGQKTGDMIQSCADYWWKIMCDMRGHKETIFAINQYVQQVALLDPTQIDLMQGITDGAKEYLADSTYHDEKNPYYAPDFTRVFAASIYDCWIWGDPDSYGDPNAVPNTMAEQFINLCGSGCNSVAVLGSSNIYGRTISTQMRHTTQAGLCYQASAVYKSKDGAFNDFWSVGNVPTPNGLLLVNNKGVSIGNHFGGSTTQFSLDRGCYGGAYGIPWPNLLFYAIKNADTAEDAIDILIHGNEKYRQATDRKTILRDGAWSWMVCDKDSLTVLEVSPDRYAIRHPGEFTGDWKQKDYIVSANHFICDYSFDENENRTDIPMSIFNIIQGSEERFWTLMWEMKDFAGKIDIHTLQYVFSQTYLRNKDTGDYIYTMVDEKGNFLTAGQALGCVQGTLDDNGLSKGTNAGKIAILDGGNSSCYFCLGNPMDWAGEWDNFTFTEG